MVNIKCFEYSRRGKTISRGTWIFKLLEPQTKAQTKSMKYKHMLIQSGSIDTHWFEGDTDGTECYLMLWRLTFRFFTNPQNFTHWQYWHQRLYYVKTKNSGNKMYPQWGLNPGPLIPSPTLSFRFSLGKVSDANVANVVRLRKTGITQNCRCCQCWHQRFQQKQESYLQWGSTWWPLVQ